MGLLRRCPLAFVAVALLFVGACGAGPDPLAAEGARVAPLDRSEAPTADETEAPALTGLGDAPRPTPTPTRSPSKKPVVKKKTSPPRKPTAEKLAPAPPKPAPPDCEPKYVGTQASRADAKAALTDAAGRTYWPTSAPGLKVPLNLVKATAYQESGWQSNIVACDGGIGLMQVMPDTAAFVNQRFDQSYDIDDYRDNATLGANYLAWLIKYFGDVYFAGSYDADPADCADHSDLCLLNAVIAAYNFGPGAVDTDEGLVIPNPRYVDNVRSLMESCPCLSW